MRRSFILPLILLSVAIGALYLLLLPANHTEAEDAFWYAHDVENASIQEMMHPHHLLYTPLNRAIYLTGIAERSYPLMVGVSLVLGVATVCLFVLLLRKVGMPSGYALVMGASLAFSYGYWRYSVEAEVYILAAFAATALCWVVLSNVHLVIIVAVALLAMAAHVVNATLVFVAVPLWYAWQRRWRDAILYTLSTGICVVPLVYLMLRYPTQAPEKLSIATPLKALIGLGQSLISSNFLFAYQEFNDFLPKLLPGRELSEEIFMGEASSPFVQMLAPLTLFLLMLLIAYLLFQRIFRRQTATTSQSNVSAGLPLFVSWYAAYVLLVTYQEPDNPEMWIMGAIPFWALIAFGGVALWPRYKRGLVLLPLLLLLHNAVAGMGMIKSLDSDYNYYRAKWFIENTTADDTILTNDNQVFTRYLRYYTDAKVINLLMMRYEMIKPTVQGLSGMVYVVDEALHLIPGKVEAVGPVHRLAN